MHTTALAFPLTIPPWQKPTSVIRVLPRPRPKPRRVPGPAVNKPQSKWTVLVAFVLAVILHIAPVAFVEMNHDVPPVQTTHALNNHTTPPTAD
jgi:hypothetical protein